MEVLGNSQIALTLNKYGHVMPALTRDAADRMSDLSGQPTMPAGARSLVAT